MDCQKYLLKETLHCRFGSFKKFKGLYNLLWNKYFVDEVYDAAVVNPIVKGSDTVLWKFADNKIIDGIVNGTAAIIGFISARIRKIQTGVAQILCSCNDAWNCYRFILDNIKFINYGKQLSLNISSTFTPCCRSNNTFIFNKEKENAIR